MQPFAPKYAYICMEVNNGVKSVNIEKIFDKEVIQAEGEIYWETKLTP